MSFEPHPLRGAVLGEVHARPFAAITSPRRIAHFAFLTDHELAARDAAAFQEFLAARGQRGPDRASKHHLGSFADAAVRWEQHAEFTTYTWEQACADEAPFASPASAPARPMSQLPQPGPHLVSIDLHLIPAGSARDWRSVFDPASLAAFATADGDALAATDFHVGTDGFVRILLIDRGMAPLRAGAMVQQLLELETYRTLCLLGFPEARRLEPDVRRIEQALAEITAAMTRSEGLANNRSLLDRLMAVAGELEAGASRSQFRFGATRAYFEIVKLRIAAMRETPVEDLQTFSRFLDRRLLPAMHTCLAVEERQAGLSEKLARAATLLRTRVEIDLEQQNSDLLTAMNERTRLQLRLQQTVEGLSIAAISYYVVSLLSYMIEPFAIGGVLDPKLVKAGLVVLVVAAVAVTVRSLRRGFAEHRHGIK
jgi:uncharacterized membrane-anchored protein